MEKGQQLQCKGNTVSVLVRTLWKAKEAESLLNKKIIKGKEDDDEDDDGEIEEDANIQTIARVSRYEYGIGVHRRGGGGRGKE